MVNLPLTSRTELDTTEVTYQQQQQCNNGTPRQYSCLENPTDGGAWWAAVHGVAKSQTRLSDFTFTFTFMHWRRKRSPLQCYCLENPRDRGAWWAAVYGVAQSRTRLKRLSSHSSSIYMKCLEYRQCLLVLAIVRILLL